MNHIDKLACRLASCGFDLVTKGKSPSLEGRVISPGWVCADSPLTSPPDNPLGDRTCKG